MTERHVIITADDYGLCTSVNEAIEECLELGTITSTNVMVNMPVCDAATALRSHFPRVALGLHWTLCQGRPVLPVEQVPTLVDRCGDFLTAREIRRRWPLGLMRPSEVRRELAAQHRRFVNIAGAPDYWNTHQNTHLFPGLFPLFVRSGLQCGIRAMRSHRRVVVPRRGTAGAFCLKHPVFSVKGAIIGLYSRWAQRLRVWMPRGLIYAFGYDKHAEIATVLANPCLPADGEPIEFVVHPATQEEPDLFGEVVASRVTEYRTLRDGGLRNALARAGIALRSFGPPAAAEGSAR